mgnify:CR=1 FL=1
MENLLNPVVIGVVLLCVLCLLKINILLSMLVSLFTAGLVGGMDIVAIKNSLLAGLGGNGETALAYVLLGTLAACMATTGITEILAKKIAKVVGGNKWLMIGILLIIACLSQNLVPIHIAYIPILVPPLLVLMNKMKLDRRGVACTIAFGHKAPYIAILSDLAQSSWVSSVTTSTQTLVMTGDGSNYGRCYSSKLDSGSSYVHRSFDRCICYLQKTS